ncbi:CEI_1a_G0052040.mRNA.1.CDS.1 [Saccharomyces cerevisiae]|nr:EM14S01-3B_G0030290.mRNA.1.CDS.1 [Saccharomyces cerevisiae]CAI4807793.1 CEI_1a_G0052040.mRNA.1.CDS.1 [Saccharomyces cerevisiae]CAI4814949.1 AMH_1a_G0052140.mRNA.1.CDS.1 [Saccharomyces cerevisiae]CAI6893174.1 AMH_1a_G0052140.mRNA.1.CDS.1 [Saccharomyces cerevisiae]CAI7470500.1 CEI_1a_G0052040.mRNA.1.CDS.1 [Saccharomyces cerevisiae]
MTFHLGWIILGHNQVYLEIWATVFQDEVHQCSLHPQSRDAKTKFCCCISFK